MKTPGYFLCQVLAGRHDTRGDEKCRGRIKELRRKKKEQDEEEDRGRCYTQ
jgi:hypothetical protein